MFPIEDAKKITPLLTGPGNDGPVATFSPDGRWIAFNSDRSGRNEVYVVRFHGERSPPAIGGQPLQITAEGAFVLAQGWRRDGNEIVIGSANGRLMGVPIEVRGESVSARQPVELFRPSDTLGGLAVTANADRFLGAEYPYADRQTIRILTNWHTRLASSK